MRAPREPEIASNGTGYAVSWVQYDGTVSSLYANVYSGTAWSGVTLLENSMDEVETGTGEETPPARVVSNGTNYSAIWAQYSTDPNVVTDLWVRLGF